MQRHVYLAGARAAALLNVGTVWLRVGNRGRAGRAAVEAASFAKTREDHEAAIRLLEAAGHRAQARALRP